MRITVAGRSPCTGLIVKQSLASDEHLTLLAETWQTVALELVAAVDSVGLVFAAVATVELDSARPLNLRPVAVASSAAAAALSSERHMCEFVEVAAPFVADSVLALSIVFVAADSERSVDCRCAAASDIPVGFASSTDTVAAIFELG